MRISRVLLVSSFLFNLCPAFAQSLPTDDFGIDSPVVSNAVSPLAFRFTLKGKKTLPLLLLLDKIDLSFAQVGCEVAEVKILKSSAGETNLSATSAECAVPDFQTPEAKCKPGFELVRISFVDPSLRLTNSAESHESNEFCVRESF